MKLLHVFQVLVCCVVAVLMTGCGSGMEQGNHSMDVPVDSNTFATTDSIANTTMERVQDTTKADSVQLVVSENNGASERQQQVRVRQSYAADGSSPEHLNTPFEIRKRDFAGAKAKIVTSLKASYTSFEPNFPTVMAQTLEKARSIERKEYPELIFNVMVFEDEYASQPYYSKLYHAKGGPDGNVKVW